ncbi:MAG: hypothetical protein WC680_04285 [Sulfuricurvum sp.]|jgi:hypothetical protein
MKKLTIAMLLVSQVLLAESAIWNISYSGLNMDYREYDSNNQILDSEKTDSFGIGGIDTSLEMKLGQEGKSRTSVVMSYLMMKGETQYVGSYVGSHLGYGSVVATTQNTIYQPEMYLKQALVDSISELYVGVGGGYRFWKRELSATQIEDYEWYYWKANIGVLYDLRNNLSIGAEASYTQAFSPKMTSSSPALEFTLHNVYSYGLSIPIVYKVNNRIGLRLENRFEQINIAESDHVISGGFEWWEPQSTTKNIYTKVGVDFHF